MGGRRLWASVGDDFRPEHDCNFYRVSVSSSCGPLFFYPFPRPIALDQKRRSVKRFWRCYFPADARTCGLPPSWISFRRRSSSVQGPGVAGRLHCQGYKYDGRSAPQALYQGASKTLSSGDGRGSLVPGSPFEGQLGAKPSSCSPLAWSLLLGNGSFSLISLRPQACCRSVSIYRGGTPSLAAFPSRLNHVNPRSRYTGTFVISNHAILRPPSPGNLFGQRRRWLISLNSTSIIDYPHISMTSVLHYRDPLSSRIGHSMSMSEFLPPHMSGIKRSTPYEDHSSASDSKKQPSSGGKRRPSRAGTRSVNTLTPSQLERKRANDREAQRAIRQRTKDHIEGLERQVADLRAQLDSNSSTKMIELMRRNEELENENAVLRARLSQAVSALGVSDPASATVMAGPGEASGMLSAQGAGTAPSPSDRIQIFSQPRRPSTSNTAPSVHSVPEQATPVSQSGHWQQQPPPPPPPPPAAAHPVYAAHVPASHVETPPPMGDVQSQADAVRWNPNPNPHPQHHHQHQHQHHPVTMGVPDHSLHALETSGMPYAYVVDPNSRAMSYPLESSQIVTSQPMQQHVPGYSTPTSNASPHPQDYQRPMSVPMNPPPPPMHATHPHPPQQVHSPYQGYPSHGHQAFAAPVSHPAELQMMATAPHQQPPMMGDQGTMMYPKYEG